MTKFLNVRTLKSWLDDKYKQPLLRLFLNILKKCYSDILVTITSYLRPNEESNDRRIVLK